MGLHSTWVTNGKQVNKHVNKIECFSLQEEETRMLGRKFGAGRAR